MYQVHPSEYKYVSFYTLISGTHKGRRLLAPKNLPVRPTTDRAKEAIFNIVENRYLLKDKNVLDLFSGTGNIAYEFASRGCDDITAIDNNSNCIHYINSTANEFRFNITTIKSDCYKYLENCKQQFNFIFVDPPYDYSQYEKIKSLIFENNLVKEEGCLIIEHDKNTLFNDQNVELRKYGTVHFSIFSF